MAEVVKELKNNDVIMIPIKEYRKLCRKIERLKIELKTTTEKSDQRFRWWQEEEHKAEKFEAENTELKTQLEEAQEVIKGYKEMGLEKLGLKEEGGENADSVSS